jgi:thiol-disulfide isomerase/thioredoxin
MSGPGQLAPGAGRWLWLNLWAAWCEPCKEELPLLRSLAARLAQASRPVDLVFVSLDDDERQLEQFLRAQPTSGLRSTYWLHEGRERLDWLSETGIAPEPQLPVSIWVDPRGRIRCIASGAIQNGDFAEIAQVLGTL